MLQSRRITIPDCQYYNLNRALGKKHVFGSRGDGNRKEIGKLLLSWITLILYYFSRSMFTRNSHILNKIYT